METQLYEIPKTDAVSELGTRARDTQVVQIVSASARQPLKYNGEPLTILDGIPFYTTDTYEPPPQRWLIEGQIGEATYNLAFAQSASFKTFWAVHVALTVASGKDILGRQVTRGEVVYVAAEAPTEVHKRVKAYQAYHELTDDIVFVEEPLQIPSARDMAALKSYVDSRKGAVKLVIFDTLSRSMEGVDDNSPAEVNTHVNAPILALVRNTGASVLAIHHAGWQSKGRERGASSFRDAVDATFEVKRSGMSVTVVSKKMRHAEPPNPTTFVAVKVNGSLVLTAGSSDSTHDEHNVDESQGESQTTAKSKKPRIGRARATASEKIVSVVALSPDGVSKSDVASQLDMLRSDREGQIPNATFYTAVGPLLKEESILERDALLVLNV